MLSTESARKFYDRFGAKQDKQAWYEDAAIDDLLAHLDLSHACVLYEFGCGTGRLAERVLNDALPGNSWYRGVDISSTMIDLTRIRLGAFGDRAQMTLTDGAPVIDAPDNSIDAIVSAYVLDILSPEAISEFIAEARRVLTHDGQLGLISLTHGTTISSKMLMAAWKSVYRIRPLTVGGCRPIALSDFVTPGDWETIYDATVTSRAIPSEVLVARPRS